MEPNRIVLGICLFSVIVLFIYLIWKNIKDKNKITNSFNDKVKDEKKFKLDTDDEN